MSGIAGLNIKLTIFGESHGPAIGVVLDGLPPGMALDLSAISREMRRRAPGGSALATARQEKDEFQLQSGFFNGFTTGTPLCVLIKNKDQHSGDYSQLACTPRPGHADYAGYVHYHGFNDYRGGGHFSGRLTAPLVFAGAVAKQALARSGISVGAHILSIADIKEAGFAPLGVEDTLLEKLQQSPFPVLDETKGRLMQERILQVKAEQNSVGGIIEVLVQHLPAGIGAPYFDSLESRLSQALFSVPAVKAVEFGDGFEMTLHTGAEMNDAMHYEEGRVTGYSNHNGGITGGISNGMPVLFRVGIKPTPSIAREQRTVNLREQRDASLCITGRHDPCIVPRAVPVIEAVAAWTVWDLLLENNKWGM